MKKSIREVSRAYAKLAEKLDGYDRTMEEIYEYLAEHPAATREEICSCLTHYAPLTYLLTVMRNLGEIERGAKIVEGTFGSRCHPKSYKLVVTYSLVDSNYKM